MSQDTKLLSQKTVFKAEHFTIVESLLDIAGKGKVTRYDVERKPTVAVVPVTDNYEVYVISEYRYLYKKTVLGIVAGFMENGETPLSTAKRELQEETGLVASHWIELANVIMARSVVKANTHLFLAKEIKKGSAMPDFDENISVVKLPLEELVAKVMKGEMHTAVSMIGILMLDYMRREGKL